MKKTTRKVNLKSHKIKIGQVVIIDAIDTFTTSSTKDVKSLDGVKVLIDQISEYKFANDIDEKWHKTKKYSFHLMSYPSIRGWFWDHEINLI